MPRVNVPGRGVVNFPDSMSQDQILDAIRKLRGQTGPASPVAASAVPTSTPGSTDEAAASSLGLLRRAATALVSPVPPVKRGARSLATAIEGVERPEAPDSSIGAQGRDLLKQTEVSPIKTGITAGGVLAAAQIGAKFGLKRIPTIGAILALPSIANLLETISAPVRAGENPYEMPYNPYDRVKQGLPAKPTLAERLQYRAGIEKARLKGMAAGSVEASGSTSPIEALMVLGLRKGKAGSKLVGAEELGKAAEKAPAGPATSPTEPRLNKTKTPGPTLESALTSILQEVRKKGGPTDVHKVSLPPPEDVEVPRLGSRTVGDNGVIGGAIPEPGGGLGNAKASAEAARAEVKRVQDRLAAAGMDAMQRQQLESPENVTRAQAAVKAAQEAQESTRAATKKQNDDHLESLANGVTRILNAAARKAEREVEVTKTGKGTMPGPSAALPVKSTDPRLDTNYPGTASAEAYAKGATPAEAAAARIAQEAAQTQAATTKAPGLGKAAVPKLPKIRKGGVVTERAAGATEATGVTRVAATRTPIKGGMVTKFDERGIAVPTSELTRKPIVQASDEIATKIRPIPPPESVQPVAPPTPEEGQAAAASILGGTGRHAAIPASVIERMRGAIPVVRGVLAEQGRVEPPPSPQAKTLADALNSFLDEGRVEGRGGPGTELRPPAIGGAFGARPPKRTPINPGRGFTFTPPGATRSNLSMEKPSNIKEQARVWRKFESTLQGRTGKEGMVNLKPAADIASTRGTGDLASAAASQAAAIPQAPRASKMQQAIEALRKRQAERKMAEAGSIQPGEELPPEQWATVSAAEEEARRLIDEHGVHDPRLIDAMRSWYGVNETARRLKIPKELAAGMDSPRRRLPFQAEEAQLDSRFNYLLKDPRGFMRTEALAATLGAGGGAALGFGAGGDSNPDNGDDFTTRVAYALSGAILGGYAGMAGVRGLEEFARSFRGKGAQAKAKAYGDAVAAIDSANMLAGPAALKASLGSIGGVTAGLAELAERGEWAKFRRAVAYMGKEAPRDYIRTLTGPTAQLQRHVSGYTNQVAKRAGVSKLSDKILQNVLRPFIAADRVGSTALRRAGFSSAEAERLMLQGEPTTWQGQSFLRTLNSTFLYRMMAKFPRVRISSIERGIEYTPILNQIWDTRPQRVRGAIFTPQERLSPAQLRARAKIGAAAMALGAAYGYYRDPSLYESAIVTSAAGPAQLPMEAMVAAGKTLRKNQKGLTDAGLAALDTVAGSAPQIDESGIRMIKNRFVLLGPLRKALVNAGLMEEQ